MSALTPNPTPKKYSDDKPPLPDQQGWWLESIAMASHRQTHSRLSQWVRAAVRYLAAEKGWVLTNKEMVDLLLGLQRVWDPIFWINEGTEEMERPVFGRCVYWPELREVLGYESWNDEQLLEWRTTVEYMESVRSSDAVEVDMNCWIRQDH